MVDARYRHTKRAYRIRILRDIKDVLGGELFSEFIIDIWAERGTSVDIRNMHSLCQIWLTKRKYSKNKN